jgi:HSP20 family protein
MTSVQFKKLPANKSFNILVDDLLQGFPFMYKGDAPANYRNTVPVNIKETEGGYVLEVVAPGFTKEDFKVNLEADLLTISVEKKAEEKTEETKTGKMIRKEYSYPAFKRSFSVDDAINTENIEAQYVNGVLTLNLPKKETVKPSVKEISVQ